MKPKPKTTPLEIFIAIVLLMLFALILCSCHSYEITTGHPQPIEAGQVYIKAEHGVVFTNRVLSVSGDYATVETSWSIYKTTRDMHVAVLRYESERVR